MTAKTQEKNSTSEPVIVRLDHSAASEAKSILFQAYRDEPTFHYLFDSRRAGYDQRVRATIRELIHLYFELDQEAVGIMVDDTLVAVAFIGDPDLRLNLADQISWRIRMILTTGFSTTRRYLDYHQQIRDMLPQPLAHQLPLMGVHPMHQNHGYGRLLLETVEKLCADNPRGAGLVLDTGSNRHLPFYRSMGFSSIGSVKLGDFEDYVLFRAIDPADTASTPA